MIEGKKVGLASQETRLEELEYINKFSNYNNAQKMELFAILDKLEKVINKVQEINFNKELDYKQKEVRLQELSKTYNELEMEYEKKRAEFDGQKRKR